MSAKSCGCDPRCLELAQVFLSDEPRLSSDINTHELAQAIQDAIENWLFVMKESSGA
jgi:hypothetical protein